jgi:DNA polymerase phi
LPQSEPEPVLALLSSLHAEMAKGGSKLHASACSRSGLFLAKVLIAMDPKNYVAVCRLYSALLEKSWLDPKSKVHKSIFTEWINWSNATSRQ